MIKRQELKYLLLILVMAAIFRIILFAWVIHHPERTITRDTQTYVQPAQNILRGAAFSEPGIECARRTPVYPLFIAFIFKLFSNSLVYVAAAQILINLFSVILVFYLAKMIVSYQSALFAAILYSLSLNSIVYSILIMSETLFTFILLNLLSALVIFRIKKRLMWVFFAGILTGLAILCRPIAQYLPLVVGVWIVLVEKHRWKKIKALLLYFSLVIMLILPWMVRNHRDCGTFSISTISSYNLLFTYAVALEADIANQNEEAVRDKYRKEFIQIMAVPSVESDAPRAARLQKEWAWKIISQHPFRYLKVHFSGLSNMFLPNITDLYEIAGITSGGKGTLAVLNRDGLLAAVKNYFHDRYELLLFSIPFVIILITTYFFMVVGFNHFLSLRKYAYIFLLIGISLLLIVSSGPASVPRFRAPIMPIICVFAGIGMETFYQKWKNRAHDYILRRSA